MPRKKQIEESRAGFEVEMTIQVCHSWRASTMEARLDSTKPPTPGPRIPRITRLMALAIKLQDMIDRGEIKDYVDIARLGYITRARASQIMNLTLLAPDIQDEILGWTSEVGRVLSVTEREVRTLIRHASWKRQREAWKQLGLQLQKPA